MSRSYGYRGNYERTKNAEIACQCANRAPERNGTRPVGRVATGNRRRTVISSRVCFQRVSGVTTRVGMLSYGLLRVISPCLFSVPHVRIITYWQRCAVRIAERSTGSLLERDLGTLGVAHLLLRQPSGIDSSEYRIRVMGAFEAARTQSCRFSLAVSSHCRENVARWETPRRTGECPLRCRLATLRKLGILKSRAQQFVYQTLPRDMRN